MTKKTVGKIATELQEKNTEKISIIDQQREMQKQYMNDLMVAVDRGCQMFDKDFFIHVETKVEKLLTNVVRNYFIPRLSCPTPNYDQSVYRYNRDQGRIEYIWTIPDRDSAHHLLLNSKDVVQEERELLNFVIKFADGTLFKICKKYNNEQDDSPALKETNGK